MNWRVTKNSTNAMNGIKSMQLSVLGSLHRGEESNRLEIVRGTRGHASVTPPVESSVTVAPI